MGEMGLLTFTRMVFTMFNHRLQRQWSHWLCSNQGPQRNKELLHPLHSGTKVSSRTLFILQHHSESKELI